MYKRILVPVDGSPTSRLGLEEAVKLAKDQQAALRIVHVVNDWLMVSPDAAGADTGPAVEASHAAGESILDEADKLARSAGVDAQTVLVDEIAERAGVQIVKQATQWPADLIVCGTHGRRGVRRLLMGSDAEYIVRYSHVPVLLLRSRPELDANAAG
jgi:nucleotide-binding universal stress UspA family protein